MIATAGACLAAVGADPRRKVLVVDDDAQIVRALQRVFRMASFDVAMAADGAAALTVFETFSPDVVISDAQMPVMNGHDLVREVLRRRPETVCLLLSGVEQDDAVCEHILKPVPGKLLVATVLARLSARD